MTSSYRSHKELTADELNTIIFSILRREYPRRIKRIVTYIRRNSDEFRIMAGETHSLSGVITARLRALETEGKVERTESGWKLC